LSLVDPDNRRPVDFPARRAMLGAQQHQHDLVRHWRDPRIKFVLMRGLLKLRRDFIDVFQRGSYEPLPVSGPHAAHVIAFARRWKRQHIVAAVGRHFAPLTDGGRHWPHGWDAVVTPLAAGAWDNLLAESGNPQADLQAAALFQALPVAVLCMR
jgi:(1->4)-alpha-D-glucan 1-alpha-D-glucosylmutase